MSDYSFNNGKFSVVVSNIKSSIYDVVSAVNVKLFELGENGKSKLGEELEKELKELIQASTTLTTRISKIDKMIDLDELEESSLIDVDSSKDDSIDNVKLEPRDIKIDNIEKDDEEVSISTNALENLMSDSDNTVEVNVDEVEDSAPEITPATEDKSEVDVPEITVASEEKVEDGVPQVAPATEDKPEENVPEIAVAGEEKVEDKPSEKTTDSENDPFIDLANFSFTKGEPKAEVKEEKSEVPSKPLEGVVSVEEEKKESVEIPNIDLSNISGVVQDTPKEEMPVLSEKEASIERQRKEANTKKISYIIDKEGKDATRAILVTSTQFDKLLLSHDRQKALCKYRNMFNGEVGSVDVGPSIEGVPNNNETKMPESNENLSLEEMLNKATELYKSGDIKGAEELYNKISEINGSNK